MLTAIVISALLNVVEVHLAVRLFRVSRQEFFIFMAAFVVVLFLGTIYGVLAGILLSFVAVIIKATNPPRHFRGMIPGKQEFYDLDRNRAVWSVKNVLIYRFSENLFFANIKILQSDIENNVREDTKAVILDAGAVNSIDITAADERERARRNQYFALSPEEENSLEEFAWAFGSDAVREIEKQVKWIVEQIHGISDLEQLSEAGLEEKLEFWHSLGPLDEDELLRRMELHIDDLPDELKENSALAVRLIERRRRVLRDRILREYPNIREHLQEKREVLEQRLQKQNPEGIRKLHELENQQEIRNSYLETKVRCK